MTSREIKNSLKGIKGNLKIVFKQSSCLYAGLKDTLVKQKVRQVYGATASFVSH